MSGARAGVDQDRRRVRVFDVEPDRAAFGRPGRWPLGQPSVVWKEREQPDGEPGSAVVTRRHRRNLPGVQDEAVVASLKLEPVGPLLQVQTVGDPPDTSSGFDHQVGHIVDVVSAQGDVHASSVRLGWRLERERPLASAPSEVTDGCGRHPGGRNSDGPKRRRRGECL